jgi:hypothetical protein
MDIWCRTSSVLYGNGTTDSDTWSAPESAYEGSIDNNRTKSGTGDKAAKAKPTKIEFSEWSSKVKTGLKKGKCSLAIRLGDPGAFKNPRDVMKALFCFDQSDDVDGWYQRECGGVRFYFYTDNGYFSDYKSCLRDAIIRGFGSAFHPSYYEYGYHKLDAVGNEG